MVGSLFVGICGYLWVFVVCGSRADGIVPQPRAPLKRSSSAEEGAEAARGAAMTTATEEAAIEAAAEQQRAQKSHRVADSSVHHVT